VWAALRDRVDIPRSCPVEGGNPDLVVIMEWSPAGGVADRVDIPETRPGEGRNSDLVVIRDVARAS
jgi:hypothetical protein